jgi:hypothetical protein
MRVRFAHAVGMLHQRSALPAIPTTATRGPNCRLEHPVTTINFTFEAKVTLMGCYGGAPWSSSSLPDGVIRAR